MNGTDKQIEYAETLRSEYVSTIDSLISSKTLSVKSMDTIPNYWKPEQIERNLNRRREMNDKIAIAIRKLDAVKTIVVEFNGDAGKMIDTCKNLSLEYLIAMEKPTVASAWIGLNKIVEIN